MQIPSLQSSIFSLQLRLVLALLTIGLLLTSATASFAQYSELTGLPPSTTCDLCGRCVDATDNAKEPPDWKQCRMCLYQHPSKAQNDPAATNPRDAEFVNYRPVQNKTWTPIGCIGFDIGQPGGFVQTVLRFIVGIAGGLAFLGFLWGGFQLMTSSGDPARVSSGKGLILSSVGALLLIIFSIFLLQFIGVEILNLPGFGR